MHLLAVFWLPTQCDDGTLTQDHFAPCADSLRCDQICVLGLGALTLLSGNLHFTTGACRVHHLWYRSESCSLVECDPWTVIDSSIRRIKGYLDYPVWFALARCQQL